MSLRNITEEFSQLQKFCNKFPPNLKQFQHDAISALCTGKDVLLVTPTASGKTLPFLVAPLLMRVDNPVTFIILPLEALMRDMMERINDLGFMAFVYKKGAFTCSLFSKDSESFVGPTYLLFAPEVFEERGVLDSIFKTTNPNLIVVDEVHVVSTWGCSNDKKLPFRKAYSVLSRLRSFTKAPMICTTATTTAPILKRIKEKCSLLDEKLHIITKNPDRPNIFLKCVNGKKSYDNLNFLVEEMREGNIKKTLIFCDSLLEVMNVYYHLWSRVGHARMVIYVDGTPHFVCMKHTGSTDSPTRSVVTKEFGKDGYCKVMVSTISFGMGIDIQDIRRVVIWGMPSDALTLWQEIGHAGRDLTPCSAIIFTFKTHVYNKGPKKFRVGDMSCHRKAILMHFYKYNPTDLGDRNPCNELCDNECICQCCKCCDFCELMCSCGGKTKV